MAHSQSFSTLPRQFLKYRNRIFFWCLKSTVEPRTMHGDDPASTFFFTMWRAIQPMDAHYKFMTEMTLAVFSRVEYSSLKLVLFSVVLILQV